MNNKKKMNTSNFFRSNNKKFRLIKKRIVRYLKVWMKYIRTCMRNIFNLLFKICNLMRLIGKFRRFASMNKVENLELLFLNLCNLIIWIIIAYIIFLF